MTIEKKTAPKEKAVKKASAEVTPKKEVAPKKAEKPAAEKKAAPKKAAASGGTVTVKMIGSPIRRDSRQREYLKGLGLRKMGSTRTLQDTPHVRGLIVKAQHMVEVVA